MRPRVLLLIAILLLLAPPLAAAATVREVLDRHHTHGYASPAVALRDLLAASDRAALERSPIELRRRYHADTAVIALVTGDRRTFEASLAALLRMADSEGCAPCRVQWHVRHALDAARGDRIDEARAHVRDARALPAARAPGLQLDLHFADTFIGLEANAPDAALASALAGATLAGRLGERARQVELMSLAASANIARGDVDRALEMCEDGYALAERIGYRFEMAIARTNEAYVHGGKEDHPKFHAALTEALRHAEGVDGLEDLVLTTLVNLSAYHIYVGEYPQSIAVTQRAEALARELGNDLSRAFALSNRGSAMARMGRVDPGLALMQQGTELADKAGDKRASIDLLVENVKVFELVGRPREALAALHRVVALNAELTRSEREAAVQELQEKFAAERRSQEIARLSADRARLAALAEARTWQQRLWAAIAVALGFGMALLWLGVRYLRRRNRALEVDNASLSRQSSHDALTGLYNRRHGERLLAAHAVAGRGGRTEPCGLILLDVDFFKRVNDAHGHAAGDDVLVEIAARLGALVRDRDAVVRWGGEEFLLVLPGTAPDALGAVARRVLDAIGSTPMRAQGVVLDVSVSAGAAAWPLWPAQSWTDALKLADLALYRSKAEGRDRATCVTGAAGSDIALDAQAELDAAVSSGLVEVSRVAGPSHREAVPATVAHVA